MRESVVAVGVLVPVDVYLGAERPGHLKEDVLLAKHVADKVHNRRVRVLPDAADHLGLSGRELKLREKLGEWLLCCDSSTTDVAKQQDLADGVVLGGELQGASCEGAVEEDVVDSA